MTPKHHEFVMHYLACNDHYEAYQKVYPSAQGDSLRVSANRLLRKPEVQQLIQQEQKEIIEEVKQQVVAVTVDELTAIRQKREVLARMISGEYKIKRHMRTKEGVIMVEDDLSPFALLRAMEFDHKLLQREMEILNLAEQSKAEASKPVQGSTEHILANAEHARSKWGIPVTGMQKMQLEHTRQKIDETLAWYDAEMQRNNVYTKPAPQPEQEEIVPDSIPPIEQQKETDLWLNYIATNPNIARYPTTDRRNVEHWFRNKPVNQQQKLIELYK